MERLGEITNKNMEQLLNSISKTNKTIITLFMICFAVSGFIFAKSLPEYRTIQMLDVTRTMGTSYQPSTTRDVVVQGSVSIASTLTLGGGQSGTINLQTSPDNITFTTKQHCTNNNLGTLVVGINTNSVQDTELSSVIPKGYWYKFTAVGTSTMSGTVPVNEIHF